jgi:hypothetical protein
MNGSARAAVGNGHLNCALWLVERTGADLSCRYVHRTSAGPSGLAQPIAAAFTPCSLPPSSLSPHSDNAGATPAHHAAYHGQLVCLKWLVAETKGRA